MEILLLTELLTALSNFLDKEEKLGFLQQDVVDKIIAVERMIDEILFGMTYQKEEPTQVSQSQELLYVPFFDDLDEEFTHKAHQEMEL